MQKQESFPWQEDWLEAWLPPPPPNDQGPEGTPGKDQGPETRGYYPLQWTDIQTENITFPRTSFVLFQ